MVPNGWELIQLDEVCSKPISYGIVQTGEDIKNGIPCARVVDLTKNEFDICEMIKTTEEIHQSYKKTILEKGELMMALRGKIGLVRIVPEHLIGINITRGIARLAPKNNVVDSEYLLWIMRSNQVGNDLKRKAGGSALQEISLTALRKVKVDIPPLPEQRKIAEILGTWDKAISTTERLIDNSKQQKKALMQQLLSGVHKGKRLLDDSGKPFEGEWDSMVIGDVVELFNGFAFKSSDALETGCKWLKIANVGIGEIKWNNSSYLPEEYKNEYKKFILKVGDIVVAMTRPTLGNQLKIARLKNESEEALLNQRVAKLLFSDKVNCEYMYQLLSTIEVALKLNNALLGTDPPNLNAKVLHEIGMEMPSLVEQQKIAAVLTNADKEIDLLEQQLTDLKQEKKALMQQLLTGKRRVKVEP